METRCSAPWTCFLFLALFWTGSVKGSCVFPSNWTGSWFQKGVHDPITIRGNSISNKGSCREAEGDKFLIENVTSNCYQCIVLHLKHPNILQYKESYASCSKWPVPLDQLCSQINGDAQLYSMFRRDAPPVPCPFSGPFAFTYSSGQKECTYPVSLVESCTRNSSLLFKFQACADVPGSESRVEELVCHAVWKEGSTRYLVGKLEHRMSKTDEDKFRCFVFEKMEDQNGYLMSQSGDATCDGLFSATEGSRTMKLTKDNLDTRRCQFPDWAVGASRTWRTLDGSQLYDLTQTTMRVTNKSTGQLASRVICKQVTFTADTMVQVVVHTMDGCVSGYRCMRIHKRAHHVLELQTGHLIHQESDACQGHNMDPNQAPTITLTTEMPKPLDCPLAGVYTIHGYQAAIQGMCTDISMLTAGCSARDHLDFVHRCSALATSASPTSLQPISGFQCHGNWEENGINYIIATEVDTKEHYCIAYVERDKFLKVSGSPEACLRNFQPGKDGLIAMNGTSRGLCDQSARANPRPSAPTFLLLLTFALLVLSLTWR